jgi:hypothetical protein
VLVGNRAVCGSELKLHAGGAGDPGQRGNGGLPASVLVSVEHRPVQAAAASQLRLAQTAASANLGDQLGSDNLILGRHALQVIIYFNVIYKM